MVACDEVEKMGSKLNAYMIIAHNEPEILQKLVALLDNAESDIYIHWDKGSGYIDRDSLKKCVKYSNLYFVKPIRITWGGYKLVRCELLLLSEAVKGHYCYYHLLSGIDLPLKTPAQINAFFRENMGKQFIVSCRTAIEWRDALCRVEYYYFFQDVIGRDSNMICNILRKMQDVLLSVQKRLQVNRIKNIDFELRAGSQWFSITHNMAEYVLSQKNCIKKFFKYSFVPDESFLHTLAYMSPYKNDIVNNNLRCIDWERGKPYVYTAEDYEMLISSDALFARKFSLNTDKIIISKIYDYIMKKKLLD